MEDYKEGDYVVVYRKKIPYYWKDDWIPDMDKFIGEVCVVESVYDDKISLGSESLGDWFNFPYPSIRKATKNEIIIDKL